MGVVTSLPAPIKIQFQDIQTAKTEWILDSNHFENNFNYVRKAISEVSKNKLLQKVVLKLFFPTLSESQDLSKSISKLLSSKGTVVIYGSNLHFFNHHRWVKLWASAKVTNLQIKFEMLDQGFDYLTQGLCSNKTIKILAFRFLSDSQLIRLSELVSINQSVYNLQIILESRVYTLENIEDGIQSSKMPSTPQSTLPISFLSQAQSISTFALGGYHNRANFVSGIIRNKSIKTLVLDNIDIEKLIRHDWNVAFKENNCIQEVKAVRGLNTLSSMILFQSMRKNKNIQSLYLEDCVFFTHGFLGLETLLKQTSSLRTMTLKNLLHLNLSKFSQVASVQNLAKVLLALSGNRSLQEVVISNSANNESIRLEDPEHLLSPAFDQLLKMNKTLKKIVIENFKLGPESFPGISEGLSGNSTLSTFCLKGNCLTWSDLPGLVEGLRKNSQLSVLDVSESSALKDLAQAVCVPLEAIFSGLLEAGLKTFTVDECFWSLKGLPSGLANLASSCRQKYSV
jgi:hypothetical protein